MKKVTFDNIDIIYYIKSYKQYNEIKDCDFETLNIYYNAKNFKGKWVLKLHEIYKELKLYKNHEMNVAIEFKNDNVTVL